MTEQESNLILYYPRCQRSKDVDRNIWRDLSDPEVTYLLEEPRLKAIKGYCPYCWDYLSSARVL